MKILVLDEEFPHPLNTGKHIRTYNLISRLTSAHEVHYLAYGRKDSESFMAMRNAGLYPIPVDTQLPAKSGYLFYLRLAANLFSSLPYIVSSHYSQPFVDSLERCLKELKPDLVLCEWSPYAIYMKNYSNVKTVIVAHNIESRIWRRYYQTEQQVLKKWYIGRQANKVDRFEQAAFRWVEGATAVSDDEAEAISGFNPDLRVRVVDNGVDLEYFAPNHESLQADKLVFVGAMDWRPNQDAAGYFVREIFPLLRAKHSGLEAVFVGRNPPSRITDLGQVDGITVTGTVDDVRPFIRLATVYIVPLRVGGGSRLKILEALAMEKAVVSTSVGAEGLKVQAGQHIEFANTAEMFAQKVSTLLTDSEHRRRIGSAGRELVENSYGWDAIAKMLDTFLREVSGCQ